MLTREFVWNGLPDLGWWLACALVAAVLIVLLYRSERRLVEWPVGTALVALRLLVVAALFLTLLEPVLTWTIDRDRTGRIVVALDVSDSMGSADAHASKGEKLRWARGLGLIGNPAIDVRLDGWIAAFEAGREPEWVAPGETADPEKRARLAGTRRENLDGIFAEVDKLSRREIAARLLTGTASPLLPELRKLGEVQLELFAGRNETADPQGLPAAVRTPSAGLVTGTTDLSQALLPAASGNEASPLLGVVLLTDGRDTTRRDPTAVAARFKQMRVPIYPVLIGSILQPRDLGIRSLDYPQTVFKDDHPVLKVVLSTSGYEEQELEVSLEREGAEPVTKKITPHGPEALLEFELDAGEAGRRQFTVKTPLLPGETRADNNESKFALTVVDDKVHVLLVEGEARWEFRFIDNALRRDARVDLQQVVFAQPSLGLLPETYFPRVLKLPGPDAKSASPFDESDLVIIGDVSPDDLTPPLWDLLDKFVAESGGTLVLCAGKRYFPLAHTSPAVARLVPLTDLKPADAAGASATGSPAERGFHLQLTPEGENEPMLQFDTDRLENRRIWDELPGHAWGLFGRAKPGATVFAAVKRRDAADVLDAERQGAVIVHQHYGLGQVLWLGIDSTWRWRHRVGDTYHHRFWGQLARWAANNKAAMGNEYVKFGPDRADVDEGEDVVIRARWIEPFVRKFPNLKAAAELFRTQDKDPGKPFTTVPLAPAEGRPLIHEGRAVSLPPGDYRAHLVVTGADLGAREVSTPIYVHPKRSVELSDLSANADLLSQLAAVSGGKLLRPDNIGEIPQLLEPPRQSQAEREERTLWNHWTVLVLFFALLTAEWGLRKWNGLP